MADTNGRGKVAVVTGASAGIGEVAARTLAQQGWRVIALGRDPGRGAAALARVRAAAPGAQVDMILADLSVMAEAARAAREIAGLTDRLDLLVNNAGGTADSRRETVDGYEAIFAGNHLGPFLLTTRLLPLLRAAAPGARIVNVASGAHRIVATMPLDDLQSRRGFSATRVYGMTKLANILFTRELARRLAGSGITANALHPGVVGSNFGSHGSALIRAVYRLAKPLMLTSEQGADTLLWLATAPETAALDGGYYEKRKPGTLSTAARDDVAAARLWTESEALIARTGA